MIHTCEANPWTIVPSKEAIIAKAALEKKESRCVGKVATIEREDISSSALLAIRR